jgi:hypothetical protein
MLLVGEIGLLSRLSFKDASFVFFCFLLTLSHRLAHYGLLAPDPVESCGEAEHAHEGSGGLLVASSNSSPLF